MSVQQVLILAMTKMRSGICTAGFTTEPALVTGLRWVRPVREFDTLLCGDMTDDDGCLIQCNDVVDLDLISPRPDPPHVEDWIVDDVYLTIGLSRSWQGQYWPLVVGVHTIPDYKAVIDIEML